MKYMNIGIFSLFVFICMICLASLSFAQIKEDADRVYEDGDRLFEQSKFTEALEKYEKALMIYEKLNLQKETAVTLGSIAFAYYNIQDYQKALEYYKKSLDVIGRIDDKSKEIQILNNIAKVYEALGNCQEAVKYYEKTLSLKIEKGDKSGEVFTLNDIGLAYFNHGDYKKALEYYERTYEKVKPFGRKKAEATILASIGSAYNELGECRKAIEYYERSLELAMELGDTKSEALLLGEIGLGYYDIGEYKRAIENLEKSLDMKRKLGDRLGEATILGNMALAINRLGDFKKALKYYEESLNKKTEIGDKKGMASTLANIGVTLMDLGDYGKASEYYEKSLKISCEIGDRKTESKVLCYLGNLYEYLGDYPRALENYIESLDMAREIGNKRDVAILLNNQGNIYDSLGDSQRALESYEMALKMLTDVGDKYGASVALINIASIYYRYGDQQKSLEYCEKARIVSKDCGDRRNDAWIITNMSRAYNKIKEYDKAIELCRESLNITKDIGDKRDEGVTFDVLGSAYMGKKDYRKAIEQYRAAFELFEQLGMLPGIYESLFGIGNCYLLMADKDKAIDYFIKAISALESVREKLKVEEHKTGLMQNKTEIYEELIEILIRKNRNEEAWNYAERAKARTLLDMLGNQNIYYKAKASPELMRRETELDDKIGALGASIAKEKDAGKRKALYQSLEALKKEYEETLESLKVSNPDYASLRSVEVTPLKEIQKLLDDNTVALEYSIGKDKSCLFIIGKDSLSVAEIPISDEELKSKITTLRKKINARKDIDEETKSLSAILLPEAAQKKIEGMKRIIVVPHSCLHYLPFSILVDSKGDYLVKNHEILTEPSLSIWKLCRDKGRKGGSTFAGYALGDVSEILPGGEKVAVRGGDFLSPELVREALSPLPGTKDEVENIATLFQDKSVLVGRELTSAKVEETIKGKRLVHFATHGILDPAHPLFSGLLLSDKILTTADIFTLDIDSNMVVLSACNTAAGRLSGGDEIVGMSRAFLYAGTPVIVATLWSVSDESTAALMKSFYQNLQEGNGEGQALREAQLSLMKDYPHPYYWAPFIIIGDSK